MEIKGWSWRETLTFCRSKGKADNCIRPDEVSHWGLEWMPKLLSSLHHSCQKNDLNQGVWISSCLFLYKLQGKLLVEKTTPVTSEPLISWWWPLLFNPTLSPKSNIRQQSKKDVCIFGGSKFNQTQKKQQQKNTVSSCMCSFWSTFPAGQVGGFIGSALLSHRWETMCFIPLHCKSNLMLHALQKSSRKRGWMRWRRAMLTQIPQSLRQHQSPGSLG